MISGTQLIKNNKFDKWFFNIRKKSWQKLPFPRPMGWGLGPWITGGFITIVCFELFFWPLQRLLNLGAMNCGWIGWVKGMPFFSVVGKGKFWREVDLDLARPVWGENTHGFWWSTYQFPYLLENHHLLPGGLDTQLKWSEVKWKSLSHVQLFVTPWTVYGILQARILEWVAFPFSRGSS